MMHRRIAMLGILLLLPALACTAPTRLWSRLAPTATSLPTVTVSASPSPSSLPSVTLTPSASATPPAPTAQPTVAVHERSVQDNNSVDQYEIDAVFPFLPDDVPGAAELNSALDDFDQSTLAAFRSDAAIAAQAPSAASGSGLKAWYDTLYDQDNLLSLRVWVSIYMKGAAHPNTNAFTFTYDLSTGKMLTLADLFQPDAPYLETLAATCQTEILARDSQFWADGASPDPANYQVWNLTRAGLLITFNAYQVAPYAAGPQEITLPYADLASLAPPDGLLSRLAAAP